MAVRAGAVGLLTAAATLLVASPAQAATTTVYLDCQNTFGFDYVWYSAGTSGYPPNTMMRVYRDIWKNGGPTLLSDMIYQTTDPAGYYYSPPAQRFAGFGATGTYTLVQTFVRNSDGAYLGSDSDTCTM